MDWVMSLSYTAAESLTLKSFYLYSNGSQSGSCCYAGNDLYGFSYSTETTLEFPRNKLSLLWKTALTVLKEERLTHHFAQSFRPPAGKKGSQFGERTIKPKVITSKHCPLLTKHISLFLSTGCGIERPRPWTILPTILKTRERMGHQLDIYANMHIL